jgi:Arc/MetJ family transcription regulator
MVGIMRTTVSIDDGLLAAARERARERGQTLGQLVEDSLRRELGTVEGRERPRVPVFAGGTGPRAGLDLTSNRALHEALDEDLELNARR